MATVEEMAAEYVQIIRSVQPEGPYRLLGWSFGGTVAHAVAEELQRQQQAIGLLAVVDAYPSSSQASDVEDDRQSLIRALAEAAGLPFPTTLPWATTPRGYRTCSKPTQPTRWARWHGASTSTSTRRRA